MDPEASNPNAEIHVVGIGASAGGLEAIENLFSTLPHDTGAAFVVVQHLSPNFESHMEELLARKTEMKVCRVENEMAVEPNTVYLIPPNKQMVISHARLLITERDAEEVPNLPIDNFLRSLADDCGGRSVGVILSGTGSDGSRGIQAIAKAGGLVLCQDENSAKFDGMPLRAQETGAVHFVLPPEKISGFLETYIKQTLSPEELAKGELLSKANSPLDQIFSLLKRTYSIDFSFYKIATIERRIDRRIELLRIASIEEYVDLLADDASELNALHHDLLIGVTQFFRDEAAFEELTKVAIPNIVERKQELNEAIRIWVSACSTGEEAYSIAIAFCEFLKQNKIALQVRIFATDANKRSLAIASAGIYPEEALTEIPEEQREKYFENIEAGYLVCSEIREMIVFAPHDVISDAHFTKLDLVTCRNMLIYFQPPLQKKVISLFHFALRTGGYLFLGPSETPGDLMDEFESESKKWRIYRKRRDVRLPSSIKLLAGGAKQLKTIGRTRVTDRYTPESQMLSTYDRLLNSYMPPSFLVDEEGNLLHSFGGSERYLVFRGGRVSAKLIDIIHEDLRTTVSRAMQHASIEMKIVKYTGISVKTSFGIENLRLVVNPICDPQTYVVQTLITFEPHDPITTKASDDHGELVDVNRLSQDHIDRLEAQLRYSKENLQAAVEELETTNEELESTNEELIASNEEMHSTNEELQSVNEELYSVNAEYQRKIAELIEANDDMDNLYRSTEVGVIFLDEEQKIRRFTPKIGETFHLIPQDIGRPIEIFAHNLIDIDVQSEIEKVIETNESNTRQLRDRQGNFWLLKITPYRTQLERDGVVLTLINTNSVTHAAIELERYREIVEASLSAIIRTEADGTISHWNSGAERVFGYSSEEAIGQSVKMLSPPELADQHAEVFEKLDGGESVHDLQTEWVAKDDSRRFVILNIASLKDADGQIIGSSAVCHDLTQNVELTARSRVFERAFESSLTAMVISDPRLEGNPIVYANPGFERLTGYSSQEVVGRNCRFLQGDETNPATINKIRESIQKGVACHVKILNYRKSGEKFWNELVVTPVKAESGEVTHFVGVQFDMTAQQRYEDRLSRERDVAEAANAAKSIFVANMSHEIRTPLTTVVGMTELLLDQEVEKSKHDILQLIHQSGRHLVNLVNDILDISKIEAGKLESHVMTVSPVDILNDVAGTMRYRANEKGLKFEFLYEGLLPETMRTDPIRLRQILFNLIGNAIKFTEEGSVTVSALLIDRDKDPCLKILVEDTGIGFDNSQVEKLFGQFSQLDETPTREKGGTGLGLFISRRLVEHLGGELTANGKRGVGSKFTLVIPTGDLSNAVFIDPREISSEPAEEQAGDDSLPFDAKILVVEDTPGIQLLVRRMLEKCGARVSVVSNGTQALGLLGAADVDAVEPASEGFDLIVLDMHMPGISGYETARQLRESGLSIPIVALTASALQGDREQCLAAGCDDYLTKPIDRDALITSVSELLKGSN